MQQECKLLKVSCIISNMWKSGEKLTSDCTARSLWRKRALQVFWKCASQRQPRYSEVGVGDGDGGTRLHAVNSTKIPSGSESVQQLGTDVISSGWSSLAGVREQPAANDSRIPAALQGTIAGSWPLPLVNKPGLLWPLGGWAQTTSFSSCDAAQASRI